jgi:hypothetical protein
MPLQNRVDPYGALHANAARGAWMGNRGVLHDASKRIVAPWRLRRWITCALSFKDRRREVFTPNRWTELFFLDEATALAAGHRPCAECRRSRYEEFRAAFDVGGLRADAIDRILHGERLEAGGVKRAYGAVLSSLPDATMVDYSGGPHLVWNGRLSPWSFFGYTPTIDAPPETEVAVLTPRAIVHAIRAGFVPQVHDSLTSASSTNTSTPAR